MIMKYTEKDMVEHYANEAEKYGDSDKSTMQDEIIRRKELELIYEFVKKENGSILDIGCGNGVALQMISDLHKGEVNLYGVDFSPDLVEIAKRRSLSNCVIDHGDVRDLHFEDGSIDKIYTERCLINILDVKGQEKALKEIHRVLKPGGEYLMIECFTDGFDNNNRAREECGLNALKKRDHNLYFKKDPFFNFISDCFEVVDDSRFPFNFLSSHYFVARVLHPLITKGDNIQNTEFVKFFDLALEHPIGNYSPIQVFLLKKKG